MGVSAWDTPPLDRRQHREYWKPHVHLSHSRSRQFLSLPMATNLHQTTLNLHPYEQPDGTSPRMVLSRRGFKLPHYRLRQSCSLNMHRVASSLLIATLFVTLLAFITFPQFADIRLPQALQTAIPTFNRPEHSSSTTEKSTPVDNYDNKNHQDNFEESGGNTSSIHEDSIATKRNDNISNFEGDGENMSNKEKQGQAYTILDGLKETTGEKGTSHVPLSIPAEGLTNEQDNFNRLDETKRGKEVSAQGVSDLSLQEDQLLAEVPASEASEREPSREQRKSPASEISILQNETNPANKTNDYFDPTDFSTFTNKTTLNYFHLHKTGGVSFKGRIFRFFFTKGRTKENGEPVNVVDTCYISGTRRPEMGIEAEWSCNWAKLESMPSKERQNIDVIVGHQYWEQGAAYWVPHRDLRYFTVMRHPLHRKISFFYHFFVRNAGKSEDAVDFKEVVAFVLGRALPSSSLVRDAGPGYYASRLWSDGWSGFGQQHRFEISDKDADGLVAKSVQRLRQNFVFVGLQTQERASLCMLRKTILEFSRAHRIYNLGGIDDIAEPKERMNTGGYALTAENLWERMSLSEREEFKTVERVDLGIYRESLKMFGEMVRRFKCEGFVEDVQQDFIGI